MRTGRSAWVRRFRSGGSTRILRVIGALAALVVLAIAPIYVVSNRRIPMTYAFREQPVAVPADSEGLARGARDSAAAVPGKRL